MVDIREASSEPETPAGGGDEQSSTNRANNATQHANSNQQVSLIDYLKSHQMDTVLFFVRSVTVICTFYYILPFGARYSQNSIYSKAFIAAAATSAIRLHQRVGVFRFTQEFLSRLLLEDSCHYLIYSVLFISASPVTMALMPIFMYALLHATDFIKKVCFATGTALVLAQKIAELITQHTQNVLGVIACSEVFLMPILVAMIFAGRASIFLPFIYYRFLSLRYMSRRNQTTKIVFYQLRLYLEQSVSSPAVPQLLRKGVHSIIALINRLCPAAV